MISIEVNGKRLDFEGNITYEINDNLFTKIGEEIAPHTYTLTIPNTDNNVRVFNLLQFTFGRPTKEKAAIYADGLLICEGDLVVQGWDKKGYKVYFVEKRTLTAFDNMMSDTQTIPNKVGNMGVISPLVTNKGRWQDTRENVGVWFYAQWDKPPYYVGRYYKPVIKIKYLIEKVLEAYAVNTAVLPQKFKYFDNKYFVTQDYHNVVEDDVTSDIDVTRSLPQITAKQFLNTCATIVGMKIIGGRFVDVGETERGDLYKLSVNEIGQIKYDGAIMNGRIGYRGVDHVQLGVSDKYLYKVYMEHPFALILPNPDSSVFYKEVAGVTPHTEFPSIVMFNPSDMVLPTSAATDVTISGYLQAESTLVLLNDISTLKDRGCFSLYTNTKCQLSVKKRLNVVEFQRIKGESAVYIEGVGICYVKKMQYNGEMCSMELVKC